MARPQKEIDQRAFEAMCAHQCTEAEICDYLDVTEKTLNAWCKRTYKAGFSQVFSQKKAGGKSSLRAAQWRKAVEKGDVSMLIWLGKQYLGQQEPKERRVIEMAGKVGVGAAVEAELHAAVTPDLSALSGEELDQLERLLGKVQ